MVSFIIDNNKKSDHEVCETEIEEINESKTEVEENTSSINSGLSVPRSQRRGLLAQFCLINEYKDARDHSNLVKYYVVFLIAFAAGVGPMVTSLTYPGMDEIIADFKTTRMNVDISVGLFVLSLGVFPLWWSQFSERFGRRSVYVVSFVMFFGFMIGSAFSVNIGGFIVLRALSGASIASVLAVGAGTISDLYEPKNRGQAIGYYYLGPLIAPLIAPIIGSLLLQRWKWKSTQWFLVILSGILVISVIFTLPETLRVQDIQKTERELQREKDLTIASKIGNLKVESYLIFVKPLKSLKLLRFLPLLLVVQQGSMLFGVLYLLTLGIQYEFAGSPYNWKTLYIGFGYTPQTVVFIISSIIGGKWSDRLLRNFQKKNGYYVPECRISYNVLLGCIALPISCLIIGWCFHFHTFWVTPLIGTAIFGVALPMLTGPIVTYIVDSLPGKGASGVAVYNFVRSLFATVSIFLFDPMVKGLKFGPMMTLFAGLACISSLGLLYLKKKGVEIREGCNFDKLFASLD